MNRIFIGLGFVILIGCAKTPDKKPEENTWITGSIPQSGQSIGLFDANGYELVTNSVSSDGNFSLSVNTAAGAYYQLRCKSTLIPLYLSPGYNIQISYDTSRRDSIIIYAGRGKESNEYLLAFSQFESINKPAYDQLLAKSEEEFLLETRRYRSKSEAFLNNYQEHHFNLDPNFISKERARILYAWANRLLHYPESHIYYTGEDEFAVSDSYHDYKKTVNLDDPDLISLPEYQTFVKAYIESEAEILQKKGDKRNRNLIRFDLAKQLINESVVRDFVMHDIVMDAIQFGMDMHGESLVQNFLDNCQNSVMRAEVNGLAEEWENISPGNEFPSLSAYDKNGLKFRISDHQGKFIYLRFWTSKCQPCISEYPTLINLADSVNKGNLVVVDLNLDEDQNSWSNIIKTWDQPSILEVQVSRSKIEQVKKKFVINGLPRYILIDPNGIILDPVAPPPSDPSLLEKLAAHPIALN
ncbi:MAG: redoxin domain-containing protein [Saprospiraceae bacterium]|nr:redoxin domain-containing protein [Saprospiraceae bacterium]